MRVLLTLLMLLAAGAARAEVTGVQGSGGAASQAPYSVQQAATVIAAALTFIVPRALEEASAGKLAMWGLGAPAALDDTLSTELRGGTVVLMQQRRTLFEALAPEPRDATGWGAVAAGVLDAASGASAVVREIGRDGMMTAFFDELFNHLDPYSRYVAPAPAGLDRARRSGEAGVGLTVRRVGTGFVVADVNADGPAAEAGIQVGDRVLAVDDQATAGETLDTVHGWLVGVDGSDVSLTVRGRAGAARTVELERLVLPPETVFAARRGDVLVVRVTSFSADTAARFRRELQRVLAPAARPAVRGVVLDLRGNRGGVLRQAVAATGDLMDDGVIATTAGRDPRAAHVWKAEDADLAAGRPVVVLVDGRSASAAEVMAAALADTGRAVVIGSATLGKGLVQSIEVLPDNGELFVSWSRILAPGGWPLQGLGVMPQLCTSFGPEQTNQQLAELERGGKPMGAVLARHRAARAPVPPAEIVAVRAACPAAEGSDADVVAARWLIAHPRAYAAARITP